MSENEYQEIRVDVHDPSVYDRLMDQLIDDGHGLQLYPEENAADVMVEIKDRIPGGSRIREACRSAGIDLALVTIGPERRA